MGREKKNHPLTWKEKKNSHSVPKRQFFWKITKKKKITPEGGKEKKSPLNVGRKQNRLRTQLPNTPPRNVMVRPLALSTNLLCYRCRTFGY